MKITGMTPVSVVEAMPTDESTYLFVDSSGILPAMYVAPDERHFATAVGYDIWLRPKEALDSLRPFHPIIEVDLSKKPTLLESEATHE
ncbi:hypothetical protein [Sphingobacterium paludis]|uniref:Uncharacterized protein n=1 Tax=Sphingobacterium paludis TaxID=1476465 RepID=A0A4R7D1B8_9SPHI|nr:hypothetical protein [Sphingobacterium paludis]TDS14759.1 hypothetical protein B0I21_103258 [Sphingobacterium paludis]